MCERMTFTYTTSLFDLWPILTRSHFLVKFPTRCRQSAVCRITAIGFYAFIFITLLDFMIFPKKIIAMHQRTKSSHSMKKKPWSEKLFLTKTATLRDRPVRLSKTFVLNNGSTAQARWSNMNNCSSSIKHKRLEQACVSKYIHQGQRHCVRAAGEIWKWMACVVVEY